MRKTISVSIVLALIACVSGCIDQAKPLPILEAAALPQSGSSSTFSTLKKAGDIKVDFILSEAMVYEASPVAVTEEDAKRIANFMGITGYKEAKDDRVFGVKDDKGNSVLLFKDSGSIHCAFSGRDSTEEYKRERMTNEQYEKIAYDWIVNAGLFSDDYLSIGTLNENGFIRKTDENGKEVSYPTVMTVQFQHKPIEGIEIGGVAPRFVVDVGLDGKVLSATKIQRSFKPLMKYPIISVDRALEELVKGNGTIYNVYDLNLNGIVNNVKLVYYNMEVTANAKVLLPVYVVSGTCESGDFTAVTYALDGKYLRYLNPVVTGAGKNEPVRTDEVENEEERRKAIEEELKK